MGCHGTTAFLIPNFIIHILTVVRFIHNLILYFISHEPPPSHQTRSLASLVQLKSSFTALHQELLPVIKFSELVDPPDSCAVCLYEFEAHDDIFRLSSCKHVFHRTCIDRWIDYDRKTCPLCRTPFIPEDLEETYDERFWEIACDESSLVVGL